MVGNKSDDYENEQVQDIEGKYLAKKLNALFHTTSAKTGLGVDELFKKIGKQFREGWFNHFYPKVNAKA